MRAHVRRPARDPVAPTDGGGRLEGGCALVTGGSRGIGAAIARALASDGWPVAIAYRQDADAAERVLREDFEVIMRAVIGDELELVA